MKIVTVEEFDGLARQTLQKDCQAEFDEFLACGAEIAELSNFRRATSTAAYAYRRIVQIYENRGKLQIGEVRIQCREKRIFARRKT